MCFHQWHRKYQLSLLQKVRQLYTSASALSGMHPEDPQITERARKILLYLFLTFGKFFFCCLAESGFTIGPWHPPDDSVLDVFDCVKPDFSLAMSSSRADTLYVDGYNASQEFAVEAVFRDTFDLCQMRSAACSIVKLAEHFRNMFVYITDISHVEALLHDWFSGAFTTAENLYLQLAYNVDLSQFDAILRRCLYISYEEATRNSKRRLIMGLERLTYERFLVDQLYGVRGLANYERNSFCGFAKCSTEKNHLQGL